VSLKHFSKKKKSNMDMCDACLKEEKKNGRKLGFMGFLDWRQFSQTV